jgi:cytochrome c-type biogenesis protein CcmE
MGLRPKSRTARRRLTLVLIAAPVLAASAGLALYGLGDAAVFFYTPSQAADAGAPSGRTIRLGGLVEPGSVVTHADGSVEFVVGDGGALAKVAFHGDLPDLFREGQGVVAQGAFRPDGVFHAREVLAKHDETYMPREVAEALREQGRWKGGRPA